MVLPYDMLVSYFYTALRPELLVSSALSAHALIGNSTRSTQQLRCISTLAETPSLEPRIRGRPGDSLTWNSNGVDGLAGQGWWPLLPASAASHGAHGVMFAASRWSQQVSAWPERSESDRAFLRLRCPSPTVALN